VLVSRCPLHVRKHTHSNTHTRTFTHTHTHTLTYTHTHTHTQDKILQSMSKGNEITVTNDGATILKSVYIDNPAAKVLVGE